MKELVVIAGTLFLVVASVGCGTSRPDSMPSAATSAPLIGGSPDTGHAAVVLFQATGNDGGECTAEFVSTTVLLTAAHCVLTENGMPLTGAGFRIYAGDDISNAREEDWITIDPSNVHAHPSFAGDDHDIAVLVLSAPVDVTPLAFTTQALSQSDIGKSVRLVGYGSDVAAPVGGNDGFGLKRQLTTTIVGVEPSFVEVGKTGETACAGDSGGPALLAIDGVETIVGLDSFSDALVDCSESEFYQRVDTESEFIAEFFTPPSGGTGDDAGSPPTGNPTEPGSSRDDSASDASASCAIGRVSQDASSVLAWMFAVVVGLGLAGNRRRLARS
jgi:Trypsin